MSFVSCIQLHEDGNVTVTSPIIKPQRQESVNELSYSTHNESYSARMNPYQGNQPPNYGFYNQQGNYPGAYDPNMPQGYGQAPAGYPPSYPPQQPTPYPPAPPAYPPNQSYDPGSQYPPPQPGYQPAPPAPDGYYQSGYPNQPAPPAQAYPAPYSAGGFTHPGFHGPDGTQSAGSAYPETPIVQATYTKLEAPHRSTVWDTFSSIDKWFSDDGSVDINFKSNFPFENTWHLTPWYTDVTDTKYRRGQYGYDRPRLPDQYGWDFRSDYPSSIRSRDIPIKINTYRDDDGFGRDITPLRPSPARPAAPKRPVAPAAPKRPVSPAAPKRPVSPAAPKRQDDRDRDRRNNERNRSDRSKQTSPSRKAERPGALKRRLTMQRSLATCYTTARLYDQDYNQIAESCKKRRVMFEDPMFPAISDTIFYSSRRASRFVWKRPSEICAKPEFFLEGASRFDVKQGALGDCWLLAAIASLTCNEKLLYRVVPPHQSFHHDYCGIVKFMFWHQGKWIEVVIDDRLPTYDGELVFMHSVEKNEFWSALLEKAYAKLHGSYEALKGGSTCEAMEDFTGGVTEYFDLRKPPSNLMQIMLKAYDRNSLMGCSMDPVPGQIESEMPNGLIAGHAYSVTAVKLVDVNARGMSGKIPLLRVRNPWGNDREWKGPWSDKSREWGLLSEHERHNLGLTFDDDGEFWMSFQDFCHNFHKLEICNLGPDSLDEEDMADKSKKKWEVTIEAGSWIPRQSAGGCRNYLETFWTNPQYRISVTDPDDDDDDDLCTVIIGLLQKDRRKQRREGLDMLTIGYVIYKLTSNESGPLDLDYFKYHASCDKSPSFINMREMSGRHKLAPGTYVIVPSTFEPNQKGDFLLRIFSEKANTTSEMDEETGYIDDRSGGDAPPPLPSGPPPPLTTKEQDEENKLRPLFKRLAGEDMEIDASELRKILNDTFKNDFTFDGFSLDTCRTMVAMHDGDMSGKLGFDEFKVLWDDLRRWKTVFTKFDADRTGSLDSSELRNAFHHVGFRVSNRTFTCLVMRYSRKSDDPRKSGQIAFADFVACAVRLKTMIESFRNMESGSSGRALFTMDEFVQTTMYS